LKGFDQAAKRIKEGRPVVVFPEGSRSRTGEMLPFKSGTFYLAILSGVPVKDMNGAKAAAKVIRELGCENVVVTGGHLEGPRAMDLWYDGSHQRIFDGSKIVTRNTLGMGTTFASIVAASLVKGLALGECIEKAKQYIAKATQHPFEIGKGSGPLNHTVPM
ncbi:MAG: bifunctional hydroxymethylpyrimidine kinase/phosphomethylpyrimidine kinase, partial [Acidobacteriota bacterium]